jgi:folate-binding protein YgfZ
MSIKPHHAAQPGDAPAVWPGGVLEFAGRDAAAFAHAQLSSDVRALADHQWQWTAWLTAKGRVVALGALLRLDAERFWLLLPDHPAGELAGALQRFVFRSKVTLSARDDLALCGVFRAPGDLEAAANGAMADFADEVWRLDLAGESPRTLLVGAPPTLASKYAASLATPASWAIDDVAHGLPRLPASGIETHTPQMLGLDRLRAYSVKKGCYPGQEIVARTHFLGQAKRTLHRLQADSPFVAGESLLSERQVSEQQAIAQVLCSASDGDRHEALAVLPIEGSQALRLRRQDGSEVRVLPFAQGMAR